LLVFEIGVIKEHSTPLVVMACIPSTIITAWMFLHTSALCPVAFTSMMQDIG